MPPKRQQSDWSDVAILMDRGLRVFADFSKPVLTRHAADNLSLSNLLFLVSIGEGEARVNDIVKQGRYVGSNASYALKSLQDGGFISRQQDPSDRRNGIITYSDRGHALVAEIKEACKGGLPRDIADMFLAFESHCSKLPVE